MSPSTKLFPFLSSRAFSPLASKTLSSPHQYITPTVNRHLNFFCTSRSFLNRSSTPPSPISNLTTFRTSFSKLLIKHQGKQQHRQQYISSYLSRLFTSPSKHARPDNKAIFSIRPHYYANRSDSSSWNTNSAWKDFINRLNRLDPKRVIYGIIAINIIIFAMWRYAFGVAQRFRDHHMLEFMIKNFTASYANISQGRIWTLLTSSFSQNDFLHLSMNMLSFYFFAPSVLNALGTSRFLGLYLAAGVVSSAFYLTWRHFVMGTPTSMNLPTIYQPHVLGASGAFYSILSFFAVLYPRHNIFLFLVVPLPAFVVIPGILAWDVFNSLNHPESRIATGSHVAGAVTGAVYCLRLLGRI